MKMYVRVVFSMLAILLASCANSQQKGNVTVLSAFDFQKQLTGNPNNQLIDVRTPAEYAEGHLAGAANLNFNDADFTTEINKLDKNKPVFVYCLGGGRSAAAAQKLQEHGFDKVYDMQGGIMAWKKHKLPLTQDHAVPAQADKFTRTDYDKLLTEHSLLLIDFYATWCVPCQKMKPALDKLSKEYAGKAFIYRLNVDEAKVLCDELRIDAIPVVAVYKNGVEQKRVSGLQTEKELRQLLAQ